jgi:hypothetical protein
LGLGRFRGADKRAHKLAVDCGGHSIHVDTLTTQKRPRILDAVNAGGLNFDPGKSRPGKFGPVLLIPKRSRDAANPQQHVFTQLWPALPRV